ncbi:MAG: hypothetical protein H7316_20560 [Tardiphaga sp.]|uniref:hypothetical protein n=1 Tax=Tardiphaga sp. TaxID=1926292 RepID=UPI0019B5169C|nr:hypothetical protein [Tardiphaga sp.]MBC7586138.1 hypothetical protein [Tardiphaga sp.]
MTDKNPIEDIQETPADDPRERSDWTDHPGTDEPWKQPAHNVQDPAAPQTPKPDLEKWRETNTH